MAFYFILIRVNNIPRKKFSISYRINTERGKTKKAAAEVRIKLRDYDAENLVGRLFNQLQSRWRRLQKGGKAISNICSGR